MFSELCFLIITLLTCCTSSRLDRIKFSELKFYHKAVGTDDEHLLRISTLSDDLSVFRNALNHIAIPRIPGTPGHVKVEEFIKEEMNGLGWEITENKFTTSTPMGKLPFNNIIATHNPRARRFLDFACHYDSKYFRDFVFLGAIDSAVPCSMMIQIAHNLKKELDDHRQSELSLRFIFFDGEEAFHTWSATDSIYGARHLAAKWEKEPYPEGGGDSNQLDRIDILVLLDLLGTKNAKLYNFFSTTQNWYKLLVTAEERLYKHRLMRKPHPSFQKMSSFSSIEDDHVPFLKRDVPILHIIPLPFPDVWHTAKDTPDIVDEPTVHDLIKIFCVFVSEYLHLNQ